MHVCCRLEGDEVYVHVVGRCAIISICTCGGLVCYY